MVRRSIVRSIRLCVAAVFCASIPLSALAESGMQPPVRVEGPAEAGAAVATSDVRATDAAWSVLRKGGTATDAALAAAFVLSVSRPDAVSLAAAGAALRYDGENRHIVAYVGREIAPASVDPAWLAKVDEKQPKRLSGGRSFGIPTLMHMFAEMHGAGGRLAWRDLVRDAEALARSGAPLPAPAAASLTRVYLPIHGGADDIFGASGPRATAEGAIIRNPELASVLTAIGADGPGVLDGGVVGKAVIRLLKRTRRQPNDVELDALSGAKSETAPPRCVALATAAVCSTPPPTIGTAALQTLALFEAGAPENPTTFDFVNVLAQSHRLAMADALRFIGDPERFPDLTDDLLTPREIDRRARRIRLDRNPGLPGAARLRGAPMGHISGAPRLRRPPAASIVVIDARGDAVALTLSLTKPFGSGLAARGVLLNAANTAFDPPPDRAGFKRANMLRPGARARLEMAPIMALDGDRRLILAAASDGGDDSPAFLAKAALAVLSFGKTATAALASPNIASADRGTYLEANTPVERLQNALKDVGHQVALIEMPSGLVMARQTENGPRAVSDPRGLGSARFEPPATPRALDSPKRGS